LQLLTLTGTCIEPYLLCEEHEIDVRDFSDAYNVAYCFVYETCWTTLDCPTDYECIFNEYPSNTAAHDQGGLCGRQVASW
jgi:hypothetical protein